MEYKIDFPISQLNPTDQSLWNHASHRITFESKNIATLFPTKNEKKIPVTYRTWNSRLRLPRRRSRRLQLVAVASAAHASEQFLSPPSLAELLSMARTAWRARARSNEEALF